MKDYPKPNVEDTNNYREAAKLSAKFATLKDKGSSKRVAIIGQCSVLIRYILIAYFFTLSA